MRHVVLSDVNDTLAEVNALAEHFSVRSQVGLHCPGPCDQNSLCALSYWHPYLGLREGYRRGPVSGGASHVHPSVECLIVQD